MACTTFIVDRVMDVQEKLLLEVPALGALSQQLEGNSPAARFLRRASVNYSQLVRAISNGRVAISDEGELADGIVDLVESARQSIDAVDRFSLLTWISSPKFQTILNAHRSAIARGVRANRVRIVSASDLQDSHDGNNGYRRDLARYCQLQLAVGVQLYLILDVQLNDLQLSELERGWMLIDQRHDRDVAGTYGILRDGVVREGAILFGSGGETVRLIDEYRRLLSAAVPLRAMDEFSETIKTLGE